MLNREQQKRADNEARVNQIINQFNTVEADLFRDMLGLQVHS